MFAQHHIGSHAQESPLDTHLTVAVGIRLDYHILQGLLALGELFLRGIVPRLLHLVADVEIFL